MSRHRHVRTLDVEDEYHSYLGHEDSLEEMPPSPIVNEFEFARGIPEKSRLSDFLAASLSPNITPAKVTNKGSESPRLGKAIPKHGTPKNDLVSKIDRLSTDFPKVEKNKSASGQSTPILLDDSGNLPLTSSSLSEVVTKEKQDKILIEAFEARNRDSKPLINIVVIGHVDSGKSTLFGNILVSLGCVEEKSLHKLKKESEASGKTAVTYAWVLDETADERQRGITMDIAHRRFTTTEREVVLLDAPGHRDFVTNMAAGTADADAAILVLDSTPGEFETGFQMGQTKEHILLARSLGISQLVVVINKMDCTDWSQSRYDAIVSKTSPFLSQVGFKKSIFVPCSGLLGVNVTKKPTDVLNWYTDITVLDAINTLQPPDRLFLKPFRMSISDVFKSTNKGMSISGKIASGSLKLNEKIKLMPLNHFCTVTGITVNNETVNFSFAGEHTDVRIVGIDPTIVNKGQVLCSTINQIPVTTSFRSKLVVFDVPTPLIRGFPVIFHLQNCSEPAVLSKLVSLLQKSTGKVLQKKPRFLLKNSCAVVDITVEKPVCIDIFEKDREFGRFLLRAGGNTIAAGTVIEIFDKVVC